MTDTEQTAAPPAQASKDYEATIRVNASPGSVFDALTSLDGLAAWWVPVTGSGRVDGELRFRMTSTDPLVVHVDEATRPTSVQWTVTECNFLPDWVGTQPSFAIRPLEEGESELHFRHHGLARDLDCFDMCTRSWNHFIPRSLRDYLESGHGHPFGSPADKAWRAALTASGS